MSVRFLADENFRLAIVEGLLRRRPELEVVRLQGIGLGGASDAHILDWAAREGYVMLTQDKATVPALAHERVRRTEPMPGVLVIPEGLGIGDAIEGTLLAVDCSHENEWEGQVRYLPL